MIGNLNDIQIVTINNQLLNFDLPIFVVFS